MDTTEQLHFHFSLSCIGEGNGNPLQCSCLENPRDGGAWWAAIYGVTQSGTRLKRLSSSSILKSRDVTLPTMVHIVKAMAFPVVVYGCESWTIKKTAAAAARSLQSCPTLCDPIDCSPPGSSVHGIFQARVLEWGAIAFSIVILNPS